MNSLLYMNKCKLLCMLKHPSTIKRNAFLEHTIICDLVLFSGNVVIIPLTEWNICKLNIKYNIIFCKMFSVEIGIFTSICETHMLSINIEILLLGNNNLFRRNLEFNKAAIIISYWVKHMICASTKIASISEEMVICFGEIRDYTILWLTWMKNISGWTTVKYFSVHLFDKKPSCKTY